MELGGFTCPQDGTNELDFIVAYEEGAPCAFVCPVCHASRIPPLNEVTVLAEAAAIFTLAVRQGEEA